MFSLDLDHLNILVMLILAFFSYRSYRGDALALEYEYESEQDMNEVQNQGVDETVGKKEENVEVSQEMVPQSVQVVQVIAECTSNPTPIENQTPCAPIAPHEQPSSHSPISAENLYPIIEAVEQVAQKIVQPTISSSSLPIQKELDQESTLLNRNIESLIQNECPCDEQQEGIFSSDTSSMNSSSCSSCPSAEDLNAVDKKEKRKLIQKTKRKLKKQLKKRQFQQSQPLIPLVQLQ